MIPSRQTRQFIGGLLLSFPVLASGNATSTWATLNTRCNTLLKAGDYSQAEHVCADALKEAEKERKQTYRSSTSLNNLGVVYDQQKQYDRAIAMYSRALEIDKRVYSPLHPSVAADIINIAAAHEHQGKHAEAEKLYRDALYIYQRHGKGRLKVAHVLTGLAYAIEGQGRLKESLSFHQESFRIFEELLGPFHINTVRAARNLAYNHLQLGDKEKAQPYVDRLAEYDRRVAASKSTSAP